MAHGYAGVKEHGLERFARAFAEAGFVVLVHDHGISVQAMAASVTISIRGARSPTGDAPSPFSNPCPRSIRAVSASGAPSYAGGHVLVLGATDRRIRAVVAQVPTISGYEQGLRRVPPDAIAALERLFDEDERAQFRGEPPRRQQVVSDDPSVPASYRTTDAISFYLQPAPPGAWRNEVTVRSGRLCQDVRAGRLDRPRLADTAPDDRRSGRPYHSDGSRVARLRAGAGAQEARHDRAAGISIPTWGSSRRRAVRRCLGSDSI